VITTLPAVQVVQGHLALGISDSHPVGSVITEDLLTPGTRLTSRPQKANAEQQIKNPYEATFAAAFQTKCEFAAEDSADNAGCECNPFDWIIWKGHERSEILRRGIRDQEKKHAENEIRRRQDDPTGGRADAINAAGIFQMITNPNEEAVHLCIPNLVRIDRCREVDVTRHQKRFPRFEV